MQPSAANLDQCSPSSLTRRLQVSIDSSVFFEHVDQDDVANASNDSRYCEIFGVEISKDGTGQQPLALRSKEILPRPNARSRISAPSTRNSTNTPCKEDQVYPSSSSPDKRKPCPDESLDLRIIDNMEMPKKTQPGRRLACPFHLRDQQRYCLNKATRGKYDSCSGPGWKTLANLK